MTETEDVLSEIPFEKTFHGPDFQIGSAYFKIPEPNAFVCLDNEGRLKIFPVAGGLLAVGITYLVGDVAPFCD